MLSFGAAVEPILIEDDLLIAGASPGARQCRVWYS